MSVVLSFPSLSVPLSTEAEKLEALSPTATASLLELVLTMLPSLSTSVTFFDEKSSLPVNGEPCLVAKE